jgi:hypothetical protein
VQCAEHATPEIQLLNRVPYLDILRAVVPQKGVTLVTPRSADTAL